MSVLFIKIKGDHYYIFLVFRTVMIDGIITSKTVFPTKQTFYIHPRNKIGRSIKLF